MKDWIKKIDEEIRLGNVRWAQRALEAKLKEPVESTFLVPIAALCRRTGLSEQAVRLLAPLVRPKIRSLRQATDEEKMEYAANLIQIGAEGEGLQLLEKINPELFPQCLFFSALALFSRWDYEAAIPLLSRYILHPSLSAYQRTIGEVNLVAAQVALQREAPLLTELLERTSKESLFLLHANVLEIQAQCFINFGKKQEAKNALVEASKYLSGIGNTDELFIKKWKAVLEKNENDLLEVKSEAKKLGHWETVRDCDFYIGKEIDHLYFGTPFEPYRKKIVDRFQYSPPSQYQWDLGSPKAVLDPKNCVALKSGQILQRLIFILSQDFYRPCRLPALHAKLFPDRFYNPFSSPDVIYQAIKRLRQWAKSNAIPLELVEERGAYRLSGNISILVYCGTTSDGKRQRVGDWVLQLKKFIPYGQEFSHTELLKIENLSSRTTHRLLSSAVESGLIHKSGKGKATRYKISRKL